MFKSFIQKRLENYVRAYFTKHSDVRLVVVAGSVGKTSTKTAIATVLAKQFRVRMLANNHNTHLSAPLGILGVEFPDDVRNVAQWVKVFWACRKRINQPPDVDVIVQELGTDRPGEIAHFGTYLVPEIAVVTAVTPEHMEFFHDMDTVAKEELGVTNYSKLAIINRDDIDGRFANLLTNPSIDTYGTTGAAEYRIEIQDFTVAHGYRGALIAPEFQTQPVANIRVVGEHALRPVAAAMAVGTKFGMTADKIALALEDIVPVSGRMNLLRGVNGSILIDDTYNSSPASASAALQALYALQAPQRIAILGSMNELGESSIREHEVVGSLCDPNLLAWVVTIGDEAEKHLAPQAKARGCQVKSFKNAIDAGAFVHSVIEKGSIVLAKGSEGNIFTEEALKPLLHSTDEEKLLVRQSEAWMKRKRTFFSKFA